jgi:hypothetical protein
MDQTIKVGTVLRCESSEIGTFRGDEIRIEKIEGDMVYADLGRQTTLSGLLERFKSGKYTIVRQIQDEVREPIKPLPKYRSVNKISKEDILELMERGKPVRCDFEDLRRAFGYLGRVDGKAFLMMQLLRPSITEYDMEMAPDYKIRESIKEWGKENGMMVYEGMMHPHQGDYYEFHKRRND